MLNKLRLLTVAILFQATSTWAMPIDYTFSFTDAVNGTDVTGIVRGLVDDTAGQAATSVEVLTSTGGFGVGEYIGNPGTNSWDVLNGNVIWYGFWAAGANNGTGEVVCCTLQITQGTNSYGLMDYDRARCCIPNAGRIEFVPVEPGSVPTPATLALFGLGLAGLGISRRKRRTKR